MMDHKLRGLTRRQQLFVEEYLIDLNATRAYMAAGYKVKSSKNAAILGCKLLKNPRVAEIIGYKMGERAERTRITADMVIQELGKIAFLDPRKFFNRDGSPKDITELDDDTAAALIGFDVTEIYEGRGEDRRFVGYLKKYRLADKKGALDSLGKHLGIFTERYEHTGKDGGPIEVSSWTELLMAAIDGEREEEKDED